MHYIYYNALMYIIIAVSKISFGYFSNYINASLKIVIFKKRRAV